MVIKTVMVKDNNIHWCVVLQLTTKSDMVTAYNLSPLWKNGLVTMDNSTFHIIQQG
jgi:hypothetical protein